MKKIKLKDIWDSYDLVDYIIIWYNIDTENVSSVDLVDKSDKIIAILYADMLDITTYPKFSDRNHLVIDRPDDKNKGAEQ